MASLRVTPLLAALALEEPALGEGRDDFALRAVGQDDRDYQTDEGVVLEGLEFGQVTVSRRKQFDQRDSESKDRNGKAHRDQSLRHTHNQMFVLS